MPTMAGFPRYHNDQERPLTTLTLLYTGRKVVRYMRTGSAACNDTGQANNKMDVAEIAYQVTCSFLRVNRRSLTREGFCFKEHGATDLTRRRAGLLCSSHTRSLLKMPHAPLVT